ncbi:MAG: DUF4404 family protein [Gammaproteobacteria bacterium]
MSAEELTQLLRQLRAELDRLAVEDNEVKKRLGRLIGDLQHELEKEGAMHRTDLAGEFRGVVEQFEVSHPRITGISNRIMMMLSNMGI